MFMNVLAEFEKAKSEKRAIGAFNTYDLEITQAICEAAAEENYPVLIQTTPSAVVYAGLKQIFDIVKNEVASSKIKAGIHLYHAKDLSVLKDCVDAGYSSVMIDASKLDYEGNIALTAKAVRYAHESGVYVEGELGVISTEEGGAHADTAVYTDPQIAVDFVHRTGVDTLAVSVGNEHGAPEGEKSDLELLTKIAEICPVPLVMHGASGLKRAAIVGAIKAGAVNFNIDTKIRRAFLDEVREFDKDEKDPRVVFNSAKEEVKKLVTTYIKLFRGE